MAVRFFLPLLALLATTVAVDGRNLLSLVQIYRHGERTPVQFYPTDPYQDISFWNLGPGQLTNRGKRQHYQLGQYTRLRYNSFVPWLYSRDSFRVETTNLDRTFMSAASDVAGLYPPVGNQVWQPLFPWQPIPVFPVNPAVLSSYENCPRYSSALAEVLTTDEYFVQIQKENQALVAYVNEHAGLNATSVLEVLLVWDTLHIENLQNFPLPEWTKPIFPEPLGSLATLFYYASSYTEELKILTTGPFFNAVIQHFEAIITDPSSVQQYRQFSGHDINLACILNTLGAYEPIHVPGFASTIYFELRGSGGENYINIYYSNSTGVPPVPITVAGCDFDCSLQDFKNILANRTITPEEWYPRCEAAVAVQKDNSISKLIDFFSK